MSPKKTARSNTRATKLRRQTKALAVRRGQQARTDLKGMLDAFATAAAAGSLEMIAPGGTRYTATIENIRQQINAELAEDGEPPADTAEAAQFLADDIRIGALCLRPDGVWESTVDYRTMQGEAA